MTPAVRRPALADLRDARDAERRGDWRGAHYLRQMVAFSLHIEDETRRAVRVHRGTQKRWENHRAVLAYKAEVSRDLGLTPARVGGWADPDSLD